MNINNIEFFFSDNPNSMWVYDPSDFSIKRANDSACDLYGYSEEEMQSLTIMDLRPESEHDNLKKHLSKPIKEFNNAGIWKHRKKNGDIIFVRVLTTPITHENNMYKMVTVQDVTNEIHYQKELDMLFENSLDGIMLTSPDGSIYRANEAACNILGMTEEEIRQLGREELVYKDKKLQEALERRTKTGNFSGELTFIHKTGRKIPVELTTSVYTNLQGEKRTSMIFRDIHDRKEAQVMMQKAYEERQQILDRISEAFFAVDHDWRVTYWNKQAEKVIGVTHAEVIGKNLWGKFPEAKDLKFFPEYKRALDEQTVVQFEEYFHPLEQWLEVSAHPSPEGLSVFFRDITERKKAEQLLQESLQQNRLILESTGEGIYGIDINGRCTFMNKVAANILGYTPEECIGTNMHELIHHHYTNGKPYPEASCPIFISKNKLESCRITDEVFWRSDGTSFDVEYISNPMIEDGDIKGAVVVFSDITKRKQHEKDLQESLKEKDTLLAEIHHRVKNNLAVVSSLMQLQAFKENDENLSRKIDDSVGRIQTMASIHEMLYQSDSFSHLTIDEHLQILVKNIAESFQIGKNIEVIFDLQKINLNINQAIPFSLIINEVITNVLKHAFDPDQTGAELSVTLTEEKGVMHTHIMDNGKGLPQDVSKTKESLGMHLIDSLSVQLDATFSYYSENGETHFTLEFEKKEVKGAGNAAM